MSTKSRRLGDTSVATVGAGATTNIVTVPAARTAIVKDVRAWLSAATTPPIVITFVIVKADTTSRTILRAVAPGAGQAFVLDPVDSATKGPLWIVLHPGDSLRVTQPTNCTVQTYVSGTLLDGAPA